MAAIPQTRAKVLYSSGNGELVVLFRVNGVDTGDTFDVADQFDEIKAATFIPAGALSTGVVATFTGTNLTLTLASMADDNIYLLVVGQAAG